MTPLDIIPLTEAKDFLKVDFSDDDNLISSIIRSAVNLVEQKTQIRMYQRIELDYSDGTYNVDIFQTPLNSVTVNTFEGNPVPWAQIKRNPVRTTIEFKWNGYSNGVANWDNQGFGDGLDNGVINFGFATSLPLYTISIDCGYTDVDAIPQTLKQATQTLITYMYENRDMALVDIPSNMLLELEPYNRSPLF